MNYSIVIATRNRVQALRLSIPRMLEQSFPPAELIVVDSSDDHEAVRNVVHEAVGGHRVALAIKHSERGLPLQRNTGLKLVREPVVFFPDDDSILFPLAAEKIMAVYQKDASQQISAVCAAESKRPPPDFIIEKSGYRMSAADRLKQKFPLLRSRIEDRFVPDPGRVLGKTFIDKMQLAPTLRTRNIVPVEWMTGFRMTFRTEMIRRVSFDTNLQRYALFEDRDASFGAWREGAVVAALDARIFHHRSPENRDNGRRMGVQPILNLAYIIAKHAPLGHSSRGAVLPFVRYKTLLYRLSAKDLFGRERYQGAISALREMPSILGASPSEAALRYNEATSRCLPAGR